MHVSNERDRDECLFHRHRYHTVLHHTVPYAVLQHAITCRVTYARPLRPDVARIGDRRVPSHARALSNVGACCVAACGGPTGMSGQ